MEPYNPAELLAQTRAAIAKIVLHGQSYQIMDGGSQRLLTRANIAELRELEKQLKSDVETEAGTGGVRMSYGVPK